MNRRRNGYEPFALPLGDTASINESTPPPGLEPGTFRLTAGRAAITPRGISPHTADRDRTRDLWVEARCVAITPLPHIVHIGVEGIAPPSRWLQHRANLSQLNPISLEYTDGGDRTRDLHGENVTCIPLHHARKHSRRERKMHSARLIDAHNTPSETRTRLL